MIKQGLHKLFAFILLFLLCFTSVVTNAYAATSQMCSLTLISTENNNYIYELNDTSVRFKSSIKEGETSANPVVFTVPNDCKVLSNNVSLVGVAAYNDYVYTITDPNSYTIQIKGPITNDVMPYANFNFTIWSSQTTNDTSDTKSYVYSGTTGSNSSSLTTDFSSITGAANSTYSSLFGSTGSSYTSSQSGSYTAEDGHLVVPVTLSETYFDKFNTYEQSFNDRFFYTNVSNGKITDEQVYFDIPTGITVQLSKDGSNIDFRNKSYISQYGSYQLTLSYYGKPTEKQQKVEYIAIFRFRIQQPIDQLYVGQTKKPSSSGSSASSGTAIINDTSLLTGGSLSGEAEPSQKDMEAKVDALIGAKENQQSTEPTKPVLTQSKNEALIQTFDTEKGMYLQTATDANTFYSSIPNGSVTNSDVYFTFANEKQVKVIKDDEELQYKQGDVYGEHGVYYVKYGSSVFSFRIIKNQVNDLDICYAPVGFQINSAKLGEDAVPFSAEYTQLQKDGKYELAFKGYEQLITLNVTLDTAATAFKLNGVENGLAKGGAVTISYESEAAANELASVEVIKNGQPVKFNGNISDAGSYEVKVLDKAGNMSSQSFTLKYRINTAGVLSILLVILIIASGVLVFLRFKKDTKVR